MTVTVPRMPSAPILLGIEQRHQRDEAGQDKNGAAQEFFHIKSSKDPRVHSGAWAGISDGRPVVPPCRSIARTSIVAASVRPSLPATAATPAPPSPAPVHASK